MNKNIIPTSMPPQEIAPYPNGANSPMTAGIKLQQQQTANQMALIGSSGGSKRRFRGGNSPQVLVPPVPPGAVNPVQTQDSYSAINKLYVDQQNNAVFDKTTSQAQVANIATKQQAVYNGKGGRTNKRRRTNKRHKTNKRCRFCLSLNQRTTLKRLPKRKRPAYLRYLSQMHNECAKSIHNTHFECQCNKCIKKRNKTRKHK